MDAQGRDLIQRLADDLETYSFSPGYDVPAVLTEARAYLAANPEPAADGPAVPESREPASVADKSKPALGPTNADVTHLFYRHVFVGNGEASEAGFEDAIAEAMSRWGHHAPQPIPISERLPGAEDCDEEGRCWLCGKVEGDWRLMNPNRPGVPQLKYAFSHWLPHWAIPVPGGEP